MKTSLLYSVIALCLLTACANNDPTPQTGDTANAPDNNSCETIIDEALNTLDTVCDAIGRNQACYGNRLVEATLRDTNNTFANPGDLVAIENIENLNLLPLDTATGVYGFAALQLQANLPDTLPGQNVTFLLFGGTQFTPQGTVDGLQAYYVSTGIGSTNPCNAAPDDGVLIQTPTNTDLSIQFNLNGVTFELGSTAFVRAEPDGEMQVALLEGQAVVSADGASQTIPAGNQSTIPLDAEGFAEAPPSPPEPYTPDDIRALPVRTLPDAITPANPALPVANAVGAVASFSTLENPEQGLRTGELTDATQVDTITFDAQAGNTIFIYSESENAGIHTLTLLAPDGTRLYQRNMSFSPGLFTLEQDGTYTIEIRSRNNSAFGAYDFNLWNVPAPISTSLTLTPPEVEPTTGLVEGEIATYGQSNLYTIDLEAGQRIFFDSIASSAGGAFRWDWIPPDGTEGFIDENLGFDSTIITIEQTGTYTLHIFGRGDTIGTYSFRIWDVPPEPEPTSITLTPPEVEPETGLIEGAIPSPGQIEIYTIDLEAGQRIFFDSIASSAGGTFRWDWIPPDGTEGLVNQNLGFDSTIFTIEQTGTYTLRIFGSGDTIGTYSFRIWDVPPGPEPIPITLTLPEADPQTGLIEGAIPSPGQIAIYTIDLEAGQRIFFDSIASSAGGTFRWDWTPPDGTDGFVDENLGFDSDIISIEQTGTYTLRIFGRGDTIGTYSFRIWDVPPEPEPIPITLTRAASDPEIGLVEGAILSPGQIAIYTIELNARQRIFFDSISSSAGGAFRWNWILPDGTEGFTDGNLGLDSDIIGIRQTGTYTLRIYGRGDTTGTFSFRLVPANNE